MSASWRTTREVNSAVVSGVCNTARPAASDRLRKSSVGSMPWVNTLQGRSYEIISRNDSVAPSAASLLR